MKGFYKIVLIFVVLMRSKHYCLDPDLHHFTILVQVSLTTVHSDLMSTS